jgi:transposase
MIQLTAQMRILVAVEPVDFRRGIDGLCRLCRQALATDPFSGAVFVFRSRRGTGVKIPLFARIRAGRITRGPGALLRSPSEPVDS